jgi:disease resistance protein RPM1
MKPQTQTNCEHSSKRTKEAMAEAVVEVLIGKLSLVLAREAATATFGASLLCKEASALKGLFGEICKANGELELMKAYLRDLLT